VARDGGHDVRDAQRPPPARGGGRGGEASAELRALSSLAQAARGQQIQEIQPAPAAKRIQQRFSGSPLRLRPDTSAPPKEKTILPPLPGPQQARRYGTIISFLLCVVVPLVIAAVYYLSIVSPQYVSEFRFSVKDTSVNTNVGSNSLLAAFGGGGMGASTENYLVVDYLTSRQVIEDLQQRIPVIELYSKPEIDAWSRFDRSLPMEQFVRYWQKMVIARYDQITGIATAEVHAFSPQDALLIASTMVGLSEELVNRIANRTRADAVRFAEQEVERAQERLRRVRAQLTERNAGRGGNGTDPAGQALLLDLERQIAQNMLASAMQTLDQARTNAAAQQLYITPYVRPSLPQSPSYPRKLLSIAMVGALAFAVWLSSLLIVRSIMERFH
jgi:capsule polysaccharide export protein KpsE/RkpR